jgi:superfamily II DNA/RNA helicase
MFRAKSVENNLVITKFTMAFQRNARFGRQGGSSGGGRGRSRNRQNGAFIDERKFISKAQPIAAQAPYVPSFKYADLDVHQVLKRNIESKGFAEPTPIQDQIIPHIMAGKDVLGIANTGTGKTAAFLIPLIHKVINNPGERVLIITPTRELAEQIGDELYLLTWDLQQSGVLCIGGANISQQMSHLRRTPHYVVGTPGRLKDLIDRRALDLTKFTTVVLDEVDRMLDMGFINEIKALIAYLPPTRQSLFFSATVDKSVEPIINLILKKDYVRISVKTGDTALNVDQDIVRVYNKEEKVEKLIELLKKDGFERVLVFINMKWHVDKIETLLRARGFKVESLHGDKRQSQRSRAVENFKNGRANILLATDVAARGLDIDNITHVINFDIPKAYEDYVHRIGRTGRANKMGVALTFVEGTQNTRR